MLVEFPSVVDAVRCAVEVQQATPEWNTGVAADNRIELRIGINLGDVIVEGDDLYGDGVNIATRLEGLAASGSRTPGLELGQVHHPHTMRPQRFEAIHRRLHLTAKGGARACDRSRR